MVACRFPACFLIVSLCLVLGTHSQTFLCKNGESSGSRRDCSDTTKTCSSTATSCVVRCIDGEGANVCRNIVLDCTRMSSGSCRVECEYDGSRGSLCSGITIRAGSSVTPEVRCLEASSCTGSITFEGGKNPQVLNSASSGWTNGLDVFCRHNAGSCRTNCNGVTCRDAALRCQKGHCEYGCGNRCTSGTSLTCDPGTSCSCSGSTCSSVQFNTPTPTGNPTLKPTANPSAAPTRNPSANPTQNPTKNPTRQPTTNPTQNPSQNPTTENPTTNPTRNPTSMPTDAPSRKPSQAPSSNPTRKPTMTPTKNPTKKPTESPTRNPTRNPTKNPSSPPTISPTRNPTKNPTSSPTELPSHVPTQNPTNTPTNSPTRKPTNNPTTNPTHSPSKSPTHFPTLLPTISPTPNITQSQEIQALGSITRRQNENKTFYFFMAVLFGGLSLANIYQCCQKRISHQKTSRLLLIGHGKNPTIRAGEWIAENCAACAGICLVFVFFTFNWLSKGPALMMIVFTFVHHTWISHVMLSLFLNVFSSTVETPHKSWLLKYITKIGGFFSSICFVVFAIASVMIQKKTVVLLIFQVTIAGLVILSLGYLVTLLPIKQWMTLSFKLIDQKTPRPRSTETHFTLFWIGITILHLVEYGLAFWQTPFWNVSDRNLVIYRMTFWFVEFAALVCLTYLVYHLEDALDDDDLLEIAPLTPGMNRIMSASITTPQLDTRCSLPSVPEEDENEVESEPSKSSECPTDAPALVFPEAPKPPKPMQSLAVPSVVTSHQSSDRSVIISFGGDRAPKPKKDNVSWEPGSEALSVMSEITLNEGSVVGQKQENAEENDPDWVHQYLYGYSSL